MNHKPCTGTRRSVMSSSNACHSSGQGLVNPPSRNIDCKLKPVIFSALFLVPSIYYWISFCFVSDRTLSSDCGSSASSDRLVCVREMWIKPNQSVRHKAKWLPKSVILQKSTNQQALWFSLQLHRYSTPFNHLKTFHQYIHHQCYGTWKVLFNSGCSQIIPVPVATLLSHFIDSSINISVIYTLVGTGAYKVYIIDV